MQAAINIILVLLKWPIAFFMVFLLIPAVKTDIIILDQGLTLPILGWFVLPVVLMIIFWLLIPSLNGSFLSILEHELTHMLFAILTFHSPQDINIKRGIGGNFIYQGRGNWLIAIAPFFFPTAAALIILLGIFYPLMGESFPNLYWLILGLMTGYHIISTLDEIHQGQTDFKEAGYLFSILFLPTANLLIYGFLFSFACFEFQGWPLYIQKLGIQTKLFISLFL